MSAEMAISVVIGSYIIGIVVLPDMMRYARSAGHAILAAVFSLMVALPLVLSAAAFITAAGGPKDLVQLVLALGLGAIALIVLTFASWTNNANNLYSSSLVFAAIIPSIPKWKLVVVAGILGPVLALLPVLDYYLPFLLAVSILFPPLVGIYASDFFFCARAELFHC
jgi:cytosine permease